jgi:hypothetical protein
MTVDAQTYVTFKVKYTVVDVNEPTLPIISRLYMPTLDAKLVDTIISEPLKYTTVESAVVPSDFLRAYVIDAQPD